MATRSLDGARFGALIGEVLHRHPAGGLAVGVVGREGLKFFDGFGIADAARGTPVTQGTVFRIGSISKTFTAIAIMQLRERGLIDLDDPVGQHLRSYRLAPARSSFGPRKGFRLHADDSADPYVFRLDLADLDRGTWR